MYTQKCLSTSAFAPNGAKTSVYKRKCVYIFQDETGKTRTKTRGKEPRIRTKTRTRSKTKDEESSAKTGVRPDKDEE
jgi:hypothetical protein